jgi:hypothetical protein
VSLVARDGERSTSVRSDSAARTVVNVPAAALRSFSIERRIFASLPRVSTDFGRDAVGVPIVDGMSCRAIFVLEGGASSVLLAFVHDERARYHSEQYNSESSPTGVAEGGPPSAG